MLEGAGVARNRVGEWDEWDEWGKMLGGKQVSCGAGESRKAGKGRLVLRQDERD